jgi:hypothetical protein
LALIVCGAGIVLIVLGTIALAIARKQHHKKRAYNFPSSSLLLVDEAPMSPHNNSNSNHKNVDNTKNKGRKSDFKGYEHQFLKESDSDTQRDAYKQFMLSRIVSEPMISFSQDTSFSEA